MTKLRKQWNRIRNVPGLGINVVTFLVLAALGIGSGGYILSHYALSWPWQNKDVYTVTFDKGPGLIADGQQDVRIAGVTVGDVTAVQPEEGGARVTIAIDPGHPLYSNAHLTLKTKTPLNDPYITLEPGGPPAPKLPTDGSAHIPASQTERLTQPFEILNKLDKRTRSALTHLLNEANVGLQDAPDQLPGALRATSNTLNQLRPVVTALQTRRETVQKLVTSLSQISAAVGKDDKRLANLMTSLQKTLATIGNHDGDLKKALGQLPGLTTDLRQAMSSASRLTTQLNPTLENLNKASDTLPATLHRLTQTVKQARPVVKAAKPVVRKAGPLVDDLRPLVADVDVALRDLKPTTAKLPNATRQIAPWMPNLAAFVYQTSSAFSLHDANGGYGRAQVFVDAANPLGGLQDEGSGTSPGPGDEARPTKQGGN